MKTILTIIACAILLTGCYGVTHPISPVNANPAAQIYGFQDSFPGQATVQVTRDNGWMGKACGAVVGMDKAKAAKLGPGQTVSLHVKPGKHIASVSMNRGICDTGIKEVAISPSAGDDIHLRVSFNGALAISQTAY